MKNRLGKRITLTTNHRSDGPINTDNSKSIQQGNKTKRTKESDREMMAYARDEKGETSNRRYT